MSHHTLSNRCLSPRSPIDSRAVAAGRISKQTEPIKTVKKASSNYAVSAYPLAGKHLATTAVAGREHFIIFTSVKSGMDGRILQIARTDVPMPRDERKYPYISSTSSTVDIHFIPTATAVTKLFYQYPDIARPSVTELMPQL
ncbi:hypothetical protein CBL_05529 [Carabus blaptoides fortunei]